MKSVLIVHLIALFALLANAEIKDNDDNKYFEIANRAMQLFNDESNDVYWWKPIEILEARTTKLIGIRYKIRAAIARTNCSKIHLKKGFLTSDQCAIKPNVKQQACLFEVDQLHWKLPEKITFLECLEHNVSPDRFSEAENQPESLQVANKEVKVKARASNAWNSFTNFISRHNRSYASNEERMKRYRIYKQNLRFAKKLEAEDRGSASYGETKYSDMTQEEFRQKMLPMVWPNIVESSGIDFDSLDHNLNFNNVPTTFDWRDKGVVTPVKNQGSCGSCWAFSVTGNIEGLWAIKTGDLVSLSEQELIDCDVVDKGCNGGLPTNAFREIIRMGGLEPEEEYPYRGKNETCHLVRPEIAVYINDSTVVPRNETIMQAWVAQKGPLSVGIDAELLIHYRSGILHPPKKLCPPTRINHGVLLVGYGIEKHMPYWVVKNSWGSEWGEEGYFRLKRGNDVCGIRELVSTAIIY